MAFVSRSDFYLVITCMEIGQIEQWIPMDVAFCGLCLMIFLHYFLIRRREKNN